MTADGDIIHPALADAARAAFKRLAHGGAVPAAHFTFQAVEDGIVLETRLESSAKAVVLEARHHGAGEPLQAGVLDVFCEVIEGLPLREAADHGTIHALDRLCGDQPTGIVRGILTQRGAGSAFRVCERLIRKILLLHEPSSQAGTNFWNPVMSQEWRSKNADQRAATLGPMIDAFRTAHQLQAEDFYLVGIEKARRVVMGFGPRIGHERKAPLLRQLEQNLRRSTGDQLEIYMDEMKDDNVLRRLAPPGSPS
jgi:hypothetical protein